MAFATVQLQHLRLVMLQLSPDDAVGSGAVCGWPLVTQCPGVTDGERKVLCLSQEGYLKLSKTTRGTYTKVISLRDVIISIQMSVCLLY